jgi:hypothetical protein
MSLVSDGRQRRARWTVVVEHLEQRAGMNGLLLLNAKSFERVLERSLASRATATLCWRAPQIRPASPTPPTPSHWRAAREVARAVVESIAFVAHVGRAGTARRTVCHEGAVEPGSEHLPLSLCDPAAALGNSTSCWSRSWHSSR